MAPKRKIIRLYDFLISQRFTSAQVPLYTRKAPILLVDHSITSSIFVFAKSKNVFYDYRKAKCRAGICSRRRIFANAPITPCKSSATIHAFTKCRRRVNAKIADDGFGVKDKYRRSGTRPIIMLKISESACRRRASAKRYQFQH